MNTPQNKSEMGRLAQEIRAELTKHQAELRTEEPHLLHLKQEIRQKQAELDKLVALKKAEIERMVTEAKHTEAEIKHHKEELMHAEQESREIQVEIQRLNLSSRPHAA